MEKKTVNDVLKTYLGGEGFKKEEIKKIMQNFEKGLKDTKEEKVKVRHGTTCLGIITADEEETITEW